MARGSIGTPTSLIRLRKPKKKFKNCKTCKFNKSGYCVAAYNQHVKKCKHYINKFKIPKVTVTQLTI